MRGRRVLQAVSVIVAVAALLLGYTHPGRADESQVRLLRELIECESSNNPRARSTISTASGLWQIINGTWRANGGTEFSATASAATVAQQNLVAIRISKSQGADAWECAPSGLKSPFDPNDVAIATGVKVTPKPTPKVTVTPKAVPLPPIPLAAIRVYRITTPLMRFP